MQIKRAKKFEMHEGDASFESQPSLHHETSEQEPLHTPLKVEDRKGLHIAKCELGH